MNLSKERIYFHCLPSGPPEEANYQHLLVALAEGLIECGASVASNTPYWKPAPESGTTLLAAPKGWEPEEATVVVVDAVWVYNGRPLPPTLFRKGRRYKTIYLDMADEANSVSHEERFRAFDLVLKTHWMRDATYPDNLRPWAFGWTKRVEQETAAAGEGGERRKVFLSNLRVEHPVRRRARDLLLGPLAELLAIDESTDSFSNLPDEPYHQLMWRQTGRRHYPAYFRRLVTALACSCFGGRFAGRWPGATKARKRLWHEFLNALDPRPRRVMQWDSFRLWESFAAGCASFHLDFDRYGMTLPVMPVNGEHYIGIDLDRPGPVFERIRQEEGWLARVGAKGRRWAYEHYAPRAVAKRFLEEIGHFG